MSAINIKTKKLPRDGKGKLSRKFEANGKTYRILDAEKDGITIERWTAFQRMSLVVGFSATFADFIRNLDKAIEICNGVVSRTHQFTDLALHLAAMKKGITSTDEKAYDFSFYFCTLFIVEDDEDLTTFDETHAEEKISNWNKEGFDAQDFFLLSRSGISGFWNAYKNTLTVMGNSGISISTDNTSEKEEK